MGVRALGDRFDACGVRFIVSLLIITCGLGVRAGGEGEADQLRHNRVIDKKSSLIVDLPSGDGKVKGFRLRNYKAWRGIPYAAPPIAEKRWRPPQPVEPWAPKTLDATKYKPNCLQPSPPSWYSINKVRESSEDCLYVDVYVPDIKQKDSKISNSNNSSSENGLAVMIWIHGGDYQYGGSNDRETEHPPWALESGVIYVSVNYRLSVFGYLGSEKLRSRDVTTPGSTGNYGAQDQRAAMRWTKENIAAFGGDPKRVTIFGESAGAGSVTVQTVMPRSFGLFERAITESGGFSQWVAKEMQRAEDNYEWVMKNLGLKPGEVHKLVHKSAKEILTAAQYWMPGCPWPDTMVQSQFAPVIDGVELTAHPSQLATAGQVAPGVSVIFGSNRDEGTMFVSDNNYTHKHGHYSGANLPFDINEAQFNDYAFGSWGVVVGRMLSERNIYPLKCHRPRLEYERCPINTYNTWWWAATRATGDFMMTCTARRAARQWTSFGHKAYNYYFSHTPIYSVNTYPSAPWGAFHGSEVPFVWGAEFELTGQAEVALSKTIVKYWSNFAKAGDPNGAVSLKKLASDRKLPHWPRLVTNVSDGMIRLATGEWRPYTSDFDRANVTAVEGLRKRECDFWDVVNDFVVDPIPLQKRREEERVIRKEASINETLMVGEKKRLLQGREGKSTADTDDAIRFSPFTTTWQSPDTVPEMPTPRSNFGVATVGNRLIFTVGGLSARREGSQARVHEDSGIVEIFNAKKGSWIKGPPLNHERSGLGIVAVKGRHHKHKITTRLFALGGMYGASVNFYAVPYVEVLDVETHIDGSLVTNETDFATRRTWTRISDFPVNRTELSLCVVAGRLYAVGGAGATKLGSGDSMWSIPVYSEDGKSLLSLKEQSKLSWRKEPSMPTPRASVRAWAFDGQLYVAGGMRGFLASSLDPDPLPVVETYDPNTRTWKVSTLSLPEAVHSAGSTVVPAGFFGKGTNSFLVIAGGYGNRGDSTEVFALENTKNALWRALPSLSVARMALSIAAAHGCLYALGGMAKDPGAHANPVTASPITAVVEKFCPQESVEKPLLEEL